MAGKQTGRRAGQARYQDQQTGEGREEAYGDRHGEGERQEDEVERDFLGGRGTTSDQQAEKITLLYTYAQSLFNKVNELTATTSILKPDVVLLKRGQMATYKMQ
jgi:hypothetical protein